MNWQRINLYAIGCDQFTISKALVSGEPLYTLWDGEKMVQIFKTPEEAKSMAEKEVESV